MRLTKRRLLGGISGWLGAISLVPAWGALQPTARQSEGPFYPRPEDMLVDRDNDLVKVAGVVKRAGGEILHLRGQLKNRKGQILAGARVEIWQCDVNGRYLHGADRALTVPRDAAFQGFGTAETDANGMFSFRTIKPVPYPGRTPHIHAKVFHPTSGASLTTQFYIAGEKRNQRDGLFRRLRKAERQSVLMHLERNAADEWQARIDVVL